MYMHACEHLYVYVFVITWVRVQARRYVCALVGLWFVHTNYADFICTLTVLKNMNYPQSD